MGNEQPVVTLLNGDDDFSIDRLVAEHETKVDVNPANAELNTTRIDGNTFNLDQLLTTAAALPFLAARRLVILTNFTGKLAASEKEREKFLTNLEKIPPTTDLLLVEYKLLTEDKDRNKGKLHWLERWAGKHPQRLAVKTFRLPKGDELVKRIQQLAQESGGRIERDAALYLGERVDGNLRTAHQEIAKLLAYVNYRRPISFADVELITADTGRGDVFAMVDALGARNGREAMKTLHRLMEYNDYFSLYGMIVRQFRLLIQAREILDNNGSADDIGRLLKLPNFVARKIAVQAARLSQADLEAAYRRLVEVDLAYKTGQASDRLVLEYFVTAFTTSPDQHLTDGKMPTGS